MNDRLLDIFRNASTRPGVYLMKHRSGKVIYVGKARHLKRRLMSYLKPPDQLDPKTRVLMSRIAGLETIVTASEHEALILESNLIKTHRPRYNVILKDDKRYPFLRLDTTHPFPCLSVVRNIRRDGAKYFGPYSSAHAVRQTLKFVDRTFQLRKCKDTEFDRRLRPCLHHEMGVCLGPCCLDVSPEDYAAMVRRVVLFLSGRTPLLVQELKSAMNEAARLEAFENAAVLRDTVQAVERTLERQVAVTADLKDRDVLALARDDDRAVVAQLTVRSGTVQGSRWFAVPDVLATAAEIMAAVIRYQYEASGDIPSEIVMADYPEDADMMAEWLSDLAGRKVTVSVPKRGERVRLVKMAIDNARQRLVEMAAETDKRPDLLNRLTRSLRLNRVPMRMECIDNSNLQGNFPVAGLAVYIDGRPSPAHYRRFRIQTVTGPDDYASMAEVIGRRFGPDRKDPDLPDLLVIDGGRGQLSVVMTILAELGLADAMDVVAIAKPNREQGETVDKLFKPGRVNPIRLSAHSDEIRLLQRIRDAAHRSAVTFHRQRRNRAAIQSRLEEIPGIGTKRRQALLTHFGSMEAIAAASIDALIQVPGMNRAAAISIRSALKK